MEYIGVNPTTNIKRFTSVKPPNAYSQAVKDNIKLISFGKDAQLFGSVIYRIQKYPGDVDLVEEFKECCSMEEVINKFAKRLKNMVKDITSMKNHFFSEFKAGEDKRFDVNIGRLENGIYHISSELKKKTFELYDKYLLSDEEATIISDIIDRKSNLGGNDYDIVYNIFREHKILRWSATEILNGSKKLPGGKVKDLHQALSEHGHVKIDMITVVNGRFIEMTNFVALAYEENGTYHFININLNENHNIPVMLPIEIEKLYYSNFYYSPFKMCKRIYSLARHNKDIVTLEKIIPFVSSNTSLLYQIRSELETIILIMEKYKNPSPSTINNQIDNMKFRLSSVLELSDEDLELIYELIDEALLEKNKKIKIDLLSEIKNHLKVLINYETIVYLEKVGLNPPPSYLLPQEAKYNRNIVRRPTTNPKNPLKEKLGGSISSWLFRKGANLYRRNYCDGKARQLLDGEYHYGCHNFTGPGTRIDLPEVSNYPPYNDIDNCSRIHDIEYEQYRGQPDKIRKADEDAIKCYNKYPDQNGYLVAKSGINGKMALENVLPIVIKSIAPDFSGVGYEAGCEDCQGGCEDCEKYEGGYRTSSGICDGSSICGGLILPSSYMLRRFDEELENLLK